MPDASQSLLERITEALHDWVIEFSLRSKPWDDAEQYEAEMAAAVLVVLGERDAEIRQHLEAIRRGRFVPDEAHPWMDDEFAPAQYRRHAEAALLLLTPDEQDTP